MRIASIIVICMLTIISFQSCERELSTSPADIQPQQGIIKIESYPADYQIYINDRIQGKTTPDSLIFLDEGTYKISLKHSLFVDTSLTIFLNANRREELFVNFLNHPFFYSAINVVSDPEGAEIFIDDSSTGYTTPCRIGKIFPGKHKVSVRKIGFRSFEKNITLRSSMQQYISTVLLDTTIWANYDKSNSEIPSNFIRHIEINGKKIWVGTYDEGIANYENSQWQIFNKQNNSLPENMILDLSLNKDYLWAVTYGGIARIYYDIPKIYTKDDSTLPLDNVRCVCTISYDEMILGTQHDGIAYLSLGNHWDFYTKDNSSLRTNSIKSIASNHWYSVAATDDGLYVKLKSKNDWDYFYPEGVIMPSRKYDLVKIFPGYFEKVAVLFVANETILGLYMDGQLKINQLGIPIHDIQCDNSSIWAATESGLYGFDRELNIIETYNSSNAPMKTNPVFAVEKDINGHLWLGTNQGLLRFNYPLFKSGKN